MRKQYVPVPLGLIESRYACASKTRIAVKSTYVTPVALLTVYNSQVHVAVCSTACMYMFEEYLNFITTDKQMHMQKYYLLLVRMWK